MSSNCFSDRSIKSATSPSKSSPLRIERNSLCPNPQSISPSPTEMSQRKIPHPLQEATSIQAQESLDTHENITFSRPHSKHTRTPSVSSLFLDRYAERDINSYVPPYARHHNHNMNTPVRRPPRSNKEHSSKNSTRSLGSNTSRRSIASTVFPHHKPAKYRAKLSEKVSWNGCSDSFLPFRYTIEGHLLQVGAGYLLDPHFLYYYKQDPLQCQVEHKYHRTNEIWMYHRQSCNQIRYDTEYLYGMLLSACRNITNKTIIKHINNKNGIFAWAELRQDFDNDGSKVVQMEKLDNIINTSFKTTEHDSLAACIDQFLAALHELEILVEEDYSETHKKRMLLKNVRGVPGISHLVQKCRDDTHIMTFDTMASYLRENSTNIEIAPSSSRKRVMHTISEKQAKTSRAMIQEKEIKDSTKQKDNKSIKIGGLPAQSPCTKAPNLTSMVDYGTDNDACMKQIYTMHSIGHDADSEDDAIVVRAHLEYTIPGNRHYAISDNGADSSILGIHCHVISHTGRNAYLIGYDPTTTKSAKIPIVSGYIKVMSQVHIPIVLQINEAPYNANSPVTLLSEYQARNHGTIIDSVSCRHKTISGTYGTQRMAVSPNIYVPFVDRGGLMGFEILPWEEGDQDRFQIFEITSDTKWTPRTYLQDDPDIQATHSQEVLLNSHEHDDFHDAVQVESLLNDYLTYWILNDVLAHDVVNPHSQCVDRTRTTAQHGGDLNPHYIEVTLSNIADPHGNAGPDLALQHFLEPDPDLQHFFDAISSPTEEILLVDKGSVPRTFSEKILSVDKGSVPKNVSLLMNPYWNEPYVDTNRHPFVPVAPKNPYSGNAQLNMYRYKQPIATSITFFPRSTKKDYNDIRFSHVSSPPAQPSKVELPTREKKTEPVQDPVPRVKGIRGTPPKF
jgi:hypothetical protein